MKPTYIKEERVDIYSYWVLCTYDSLSLSLYFLRFLRLLTKVKVFHMKFDSVYQ